MENLTCNWMSLKLKSPYIMASLTLMSHVTLKKHIAYYKKVEEMGAGAIVLPSVNPEADGYSEKNMVIVDSLPIDTGLDEMGKMGFSIIGPTVPNIIPLQYGVSLASELKMELKNIPVIASIANIGREDQILRAIRQLSETNIDGIELNFSCPNVKTKDGENKVLSIAFLKKVRSLTNKPISLKLTPYEDYFSLIESVNGEIDGITLSNAYIGLLPPEIDGNSYSPINRREEWSPSGIYGPFERMLTFYKLFQFHEISKKNGLSIACVGGIVSGKEAIQAILLGADVVQFSSAVAWNGIHIFQESNKILRRYLENHNFNNITAFKGNALKYIKNNADELDKNISTRTMKVDSKKCRKCDKCKCCNRMCIAIFQEEDKSVHINSNLCSGCKWCSYMCDAIVELQ